MKRYLSTCLLILCFTILYGEQYYKSNSIGMAIEPIDKNAVFAYEYYINIKTDEIDEALTKVYKTLYKSGEEYSVWVKSYINGTLQQETITKNEIREIYDFDNKRIQMFSSLKGSDLQEKWEFLYDEQGLLIGKKKLYPEDNNVEISYITETNGRLRSQVHINGEEKELVIQGISDKRYLLWIGSGNEGIYEGYRDGKIVLYRTVKADTAEEWYYTYFENYYTRTNYYPLQDKEESLSEKSSKPINLILEKYNNNEKLIEKSIKNDDKRLYYENNTYDDSGIKITSQIIIENNKRKEWTFEYRGDSLSVKKLFENKKMVKEILYSENGRTEKIYNNNRLVYTLVYDKDGFLISSEAQDGEDI